MKKLGQCECDAAARRPKVGGGGGAPIANNRRRRREKKVGGGGAARPAQASGCTAETVWGLAPTSVVHRTEVERSVIGRFIGVHTAGDQ
jgi:hypothetical protein